MRNNKVFSLLSGGICFMLVFAVLLPPAYTQSKPGGKVKKDPIKIGVLEGLSGSFAIQGPKVVAGYQLAVRMVNEAGGLLGRSVELIVRDDRANPEVGARLARSLYYDQGLDFVFAGDISPVSIAVSQVAREAKKIFLVHSAQAAEITEKNGHRYVFRPLGNIHSQAGPVALRMAKDSRDFKTFAIVANDTAWGRDFTVDFKRFLNRYKPQASIMKESWPKYGEMDYNPYITELIALKPDAVVCVQTGGDTVAFLKQAIPYKLFDKSAVINYIANAQIEGMGKDMPEGVFGYCQYYWNYPPGKKYSEMIYNQLGVLAGAEHFYGYWTFQFLVEAIKKAGKTDVEAVVNALEGLTLNLPQGPCRIRPFDHQGNFSQMIGVTKKVPEYEFAIMTDISYTPADEFLPTETDIKKFRSEK